MLTAAATIVYLFTQLLYLAAFQVESFGSQSGKTSKKILVADSGEC